jgi:hypothetical protein
MDGRIEGVMDVNHDEERSTKDGASYRVESRAHRRLGDEKVSPTSDGKG